MRLSERMHRLSGPSLKIRLLASHEVDRGRSTARAILDSGGQNARHVGQRVVALPLGALRFE